MVINGSKTRNLEYISCGVNRSICMYIKYDKNFGLAKSIILLGLPEDLKFPYL